MNSPCRAQAAMLDHERVLITKVEQEKVLRQIEESLARSREKSSPRSIMFGAIGLLGWRRKRKAVA
jgi:hypothetical protein